MTKNYDSAKTAATEFFGWLCNGEAHMALFVLCEASPPVGDMAYDLAGERIRSLSLECHRFRQVLSRFRQLMRERKLWPDGYRAGNPANKDVWRAERDHFRDSFRGKAEKLRAQLTAKLSTNRAA
jgi:hypothetical protein